MTAVYTQFTLLPTLHAFVTAGLVLSCLVPYSSRVHSESGDLKRLHLRQPTKLQTRIVRESSGSIGIVVGVDAIIVGQRGVLFELRRSHVMKPARSPYNCLAIRAVRYAAWTTLICISLHCLARRG